MQSASCIAASSVDKNHVSWQKGLSQPAISIKSLKLLTIFIFSLASGIVYERMNHLDVFGTKYQPD